MSPYKTHLEAISDISRFIRHNKDGSITFIGESLEIVIPSRFSQYEMLIISDEVITLGIFDMIIDNKYHVGMNILGTVTISPSDIDHMTYNKIDYTILKLKHGDQFLSSTTILQDPRTVYVVWTEQVTSGNVPYWYSYEDMLSVFKDAYELTGAGIGVSRSVFEGIIAHLARDPNDISHQYRLTDMKKPFKMVALNSISNATSSTIARLNGSYFRDEGLTSALRHQVDQHQPFEDILRGISTSADENPNTAIA